MVSSYRGAGMASPSPLFVQSILFIEDKSGLRHWMGWD
jgi:hypothetical protein